MRSEYDLHVKLSHMMRITQDFLNHLFPVELSFIRAGIEKLYMGH